MLSNGDYLGIVALIVGSCIPVVHYGFGAAHAAMRAGYMLGLAALAVCVTLCSLTTWFDHRRALRVTLFVALALTGILALLHALVVHDFSPHVVALLRGVIKMSATYLVGVLVYATRLPEAAVPRRFDVIGSSHQWWHACVLAAACIHFSTLLTLWRDSASLVALPVAASATGTAASVGVGLGIPMV